MVRRNEIVEGLLNYRRRNQAICIHKFRVTESMDPLKKQRRAERAELILFYFFYKFITYM